MARYHQTVLVSCEIPWDEREQLLEDLFRHEVRLLRGLGFNDPDQEGLISHQLAASGRAALPGWRKLPERIRSYFRHQPLRYAA